MSTLRANFLRKPRKFGCFSSQNGVFQGSPGWYDATLRARDGGFGDSVGMQHCKNTHMPHVAPFVSLCWLVTWYLSTPKQAMATNPVSRIRRIRKKFVRFGQLLKDYAQDVDIFNYAKLTWTRTPANSRGKLVTFWEIGQKLCAETCLFWL